MHGRVVVLRAGKLWGKGLGVEFARRGSRGGRHQQQRARGSAESVQGPSGQSTSSSVKVGMWAAIPAALAALGSASIAFTGKAQGEATQLPHSSQQLASASVQQAWEEGIAALPGSRKVRVACTSHHENEMLISHQRQLCKLAFTPPPNRQRLRCRCLAIVNPPASRHTQPHTPTLQVLTTQLLLDDSHPFLDDDHMVCVGSGPSPFPPPSHSPLPIPSHHSPRVASMGMQPPIVLPLNHAWVACTLCAVLECGHGEDI
jgi:hypothetical protein